MHYDVTLPLFRSPQHSAQCAENIFHLSMYKELITMHNVNFPVSFIASGSGSKDDRDFFWVSLLSPDGNVDRFYVSKDVYNSLGSFILGDKLSVSARIFYVPQSRAWNMKIDSIISSI